MGDVTVHLANGTQQTFEVREPYRAIELFENALRGHHTSFRVGTDAVFATAQVTGVQLGKPAKSDFVPQYPAPSGTLRGFGS